MNVDVCTSLPITTAMSRLDLRIGVSLPSFAGGLSARARRERNRARRR